MTDTADTGTPRETGRVERSLPRHLRQFVVDQVYDRYTPIDHAVWRYIMRQNFAFLKDHAHEAYVDGLARTGIDLERIPRIEEMNAILARIGWGAVTVDGFIPPAAFMEFQAHRVLVIAADMRQVDHIDYTPAPDIVHEAAGHAPIIADPVYAEYLRRIGEVGAKAMSSRKDFELYESIRHLSILKERTDPDPDEVARAERDVEERQANLGDPSEMARLSRLHWWTVEYGLIGDLAAPKIYGAGLLSSLGESSRCLTDAVEKRPYTVAAADVPFDITTMQPQLFVTPDFQHLLDVLDEFAATMAFRVGGRFGLERALESANTATLETSSGIQISGTVSDLRVDADGRPAWVRTAGPTALAVAGRELPGHGRAHHADGFSAPLGPLADGGAPIEHRSEAELAALGLTPGADAELRFASGVRVTGRVERVQRHGGVPVLVSLTSCRATDGDTVLFDPAWGVFDMPVGTDVVSVFNGAADKDAFEEVALVPRERTVGAPASAARRELAALYRRVRAIREEHGDPAELADVFGSARRDHPRDWLLSLEILEILADRGGSGELADRVRTELEKAARERTEVRSLIGNGLALLDAAG